MLYAAFTFWLLVIVFSAWAVHWLWSRMIKPRVVNTVLLPGTLIAQLGHVLGLLITGNSVSNTKLMGDDEAGEPTANSPDRQRIPVVGPVVVGLLPLVTCAVCLYLAAGMFLRSMPVPEAAPNLPQVLPLTLAGFWELLRTSITVTENMLDSILGSNLANWANILFLYLAVCLTVRMTPFEGNRRGAIGAILLSGLVIAILGSFASPVENAVLTSWAVLNFAVGMLLFLLIVSLLISGVVGLIRLLARNE